jgi:excisionase family DNA binding protein
MSDANALLTVSEAAARTGVCAATIRGQFDAGLLGGERNARGHRLIDPASLPVEGATGISVSEACAQLGRSGDTVRRWFDAGILTGQRDRHGHRRIDPASVQAILKDAKQP